MADTQQCVRDDVNVCHLCGELENLSVCGACRSVWYCSKSHQRQDWKQHKQVCKRVKPQKDRCVGSGENGDSTNFKELESKGIRPSLSPLKEDISNKLSTSSSSSEDLKENASIGFVDNDINSNAKAQNYLDVGIETSQVQSSLQSFQIKTSRKKRKSLKKQRFQTNGPQQRYYLDHTAKIIALPPSVSDLSSSRKQKIRQEKMGRGSNNFPSLESREQYLLILQSRFNEVSKYVVKCLTQYGVCVVDKFLGEATAQEIFSEVIQLQSTGVMNQGQLVNGPSSASKDRNIRGDLITWLDGTEAQCENIHYLISCMDTVMLQGARSLETCVINERTKAMVACYPGEGRGYIRHVDNPSRDGRCVTCIYYLNKDWDVRRDGGLLRIYPVGSDQVANIEPVSDRLLFFWSDRRNPHEVEKALRDRYAITVWYYDADERALAIQRLKGQPSQELKKRYPSSASSGKSDP